MRTVQASEITKNIREMCIEANHFLSDDMKKVFDESVKREESPLGKQILNQLQENLEIAGRDMIPICQDTGIRGRISEKIRRSRSDRPREYKRQYTSDHSL